MTEIALNEGLGGEFIKKWIQTFGQKIKTKFAPYKDEAESLLTQMQSGDIVDEDIYAFGQKIGIITPTPSPMAIQIPNDLPINTPDSVADSPLVKEERDGEGGWFLAFVGIAYGLIYILQPRGLYDFFDLVAPNLYYVFTDPNITLFVTVMVILIIVLHIGDIVSNKLGGMFNGGGGGGGRGPSPGPATPSKPNDDYGGPPPPGGGYDHANEHNDALNTSGTSITEAYRSMYRKQ